ncbi:P-loop containing nucleoside triphosphate hydrolase protein [Xylariaceae sp. FL1019]|nr:P-loop containing nucleoside triphosphate hydrolase protein [Xylariaceae sp. FL1019]
MSFLAATRQSRLRCWTQARRKALLSNSQCSLPRPRNISSSTTAQTDNTIKYIRNIGIVAHVDAGKTTTTEQMLFNSGSLRHAGNVDNGDTVTDFLPMERQRGITIQSAAITFNWPRKEDASAANRPHIINLIDTPGHVDFRFEVERCMPILDGAVCVIDGVEGVEAHTERVWASAKEFKIPRMIFVNKLDRDGASFKKSVQDIGLKLNGMPLVCQIPWWKSDQVKGVVDVVTGRVVSWAGTSDSEADLSSIVTEGTIKDEIGRARERLVELLCEHDTELLEQWSEQGEDLSADAIKQSIRRVLRDGSGALVPVFAGSSLKNIGVVPLLNAVNDYLPSPLDRPELTVRNGPNLQSLGQVLKNPQVSKKNANVDFLGSVFKVTHDPRRGMLAWVRIYHGVLKKNTQLWNTNLQQFERSLNIMQISAAAHVEVPYLTPGQIGAITGLKAARTGDTLMSFTSGKTPPAHLAEVKVRPPNIPPPVAFIVLDAYSLTAAKALETALDNASREDPSLRWSKDEKSEQYMLSGMGTLHLEVARDRIENYYKAEATWGNIVVDYKESVSVPTAPMRAVFDKTVAGNAGQAACTAEIQPLEPETTSSLEQSSYVERDGNIIQVDFPGADHPFDTEATRQSLINGAIAALARGPRRNSPMYRCFVKLTYDAATDHFGAPGAHISSAAKKAVRDLLATAHAQHTITLLEPVMKAVIVCPEAAAGMIEHDLHSARGGKVLEVRDLQDQSYTASDGSGNGGEIDIADIYAPPDPYEFQTSLHERRKGRLRMLQITAQVPLAEVLDYDNVLRGKTSGHHNLTMALDTFERVTGQREKALL